MIPSGVAGPEAENALVGVAAFSEVAEPLVAFVASAVAELVVDVAAVVASEVVEPEVVFVAVVSVVLASFAGVAEPRASVDIALAFDVLVPVSVVAVEVDSSGRPRFFAFPNTCSFPNRSSSVEVVG